MQNVIDIFQNVINIKNKERQKKLETSKSSSKSEGK